MSIYLMTEKNHRILQGEANIDPLHHALKTLKIEPSALALKNFSDLIHCYISLTAVSFGFNPKGALKGAIHGAKDGPMKVAQAMRTYTNSYGLSLMIIMLLQFCLCFFF